MKSSEPLRGFSGSRRYTLTVIPPLPQPVTTALAAGRLTHALCLEAPSPALLRDTAITLAGALLCGLMRPVGEMPAMVAGAALVFVIRCLSAHYRWNLPRSQE